MSHLSSYTGHHSFCVSVFVLLWCGCVTCTCVVHCKSLRIKCARWACTLSPRYLHTQTNCTHASSFAHTDNTHSRLCPLACIRVDYAHHTLMFFVAMQSVFYTPSGPGDTRVHVLRGLNYTHSQLASCTDLKTFRMYYSSSLPLQL